MSAVQKSQITVDTLTLSKQQSLHQTSGFLLLGEWGGVPPPLTSQKFAHSTPPKKSLQQTPPPNFYSSPLH